MRGNGHDAGAASRDGGCASRRSRRGVVIHGMVEDFEALAMGFRAIWERIHGRPATEAEKSGFERMAAVSVFKSLGYGDSEARAEVDKYLPMEA